MVSVLHSQCSVCWCSGECRGQHINRRGIEPPSRNIPSSAPDELRIANRKCICNELAPQLLRYVQKCSSEVINFLLYGFLFTQSSDPTLMCSWHWLDIIMGYHGTHDNCGAKFGVVFTTESTTTITAVSFTGLINNIQPWEFFLIMKPGYFLTFRKQSKLDPSFTIC